MHLRPATSSEVAGLVLLHGTIEATSSGGVVAAQIVRSEWGVGEWCALAFSAR